jgi:thymidine phosphorylase
VAGAIGLEVDVVQTAAAGPIGFGVGPRLEALDVLAVLRREPAAPADLREKSLYLAARLLEGVGAVPGSSGYRTAQGALDSGAAERKLEEIVEAQGRRALPRAAPQRCEVASPRDGRVREIDCWEIAKVAKLAGAPAHVASGVRILRGPGSVVARGEPLFEIHAQSRMHLEFAREYAEQRPDLVRFGF